MISKASLLSESPVWGEVVGEHLDAVSGDRIERAVGLQSSTSLPGLYVAQFP